MITIIGNTGGPISTQKWKEVLALMDENGYDVKGFPKCSPANGAGYIFVKDEKVNWGQAFYDPKASTVKVNDFIKSLKD